MPGEGTEILQGSLVFEAILADVQNEVVAVRKFKLIIEEVQGENCVTNYCVQGSCLGQSMFRSMANIGTVIETHIDVKITNSYLSVLHKFY